MSLFVVVPLILFFLRTTTSKTIVIPTTSLLEKIVKKHRLRQRSLLRLLLRVAIIIFITLAFMRPVIEVLRARRLPAYIDISFSSSRYASQITKITQDYQQKGIFSHIYLLSDRIEPLYSATIPHSYMHQDYSLLPEGEFYLISDFSIPYSGKGIQVPINRKDNNIAITNVIFSRTIIRTLENSTLYVTLRSEKPTDTHCSVWINGEKKLERAVRVQNYERLSFPLFFEKSGEYAVEVRISEDDYFADNRYFAALHVHNTKLNYYSNKSNYFLESFFEVIGAEKSSLLDADIVVVLVEKASDIRTVQSITSGKTAFIFAQTPRIVIPGTGVRIGEQLTSGSARLHSKETFTLTSSAAVLSEKGIVIARLNDTPVIVAEGERYFFGFSPVPEATDLIFQPYFYTFLREKLYSSSIKMYTLNTNDKIPIPNGANVALNGTPVTTEFVNGELICNTLREPGFLSVVSRGKKQLYAINVHPDEYLTREVQNEKPLVSTKRVNLFRLLMVLTALFLLIETYIAIKEIRGNTN